jgi:hypothetical protein
MEKCYVCEKPVYKSSNGFYASGKTCCRGCSQRVFDIKQDCQSYWKESVYRDVYDSVSLLGDWHGTIEKVKAMGICSQCGESHKGEQQ